MAETEAKKGFLGLTTAEWGRALSTGELSLVFERGNDDEAFGDEPELTRDELVAKAKDLGRLSLAIQDELAEIPREALLTAAWQGIAHHQVQVATWGYEHEDVKAFEHEKEFRLSLLTDEDRKRAVILANNWLDDNFDK